MYVNNKRMTRDRINRLLDKDGDLTNRDVNKTETFNASSPLFSAMVMSSGTPRALSWREGHNYGNNRIPADPKFVWDLLLHQDAYNFMGRNGINPKGSKIWHY